MFIFVFIDILVVCLLSNEVLFLHLLMNYYCFYECSIVASNPHYCPETLDKEGWHIIIIIIVNTNFQFKELRSHRL